MPSKTEWGIGIVSSPELEQQFEWIKNVTHCDFVFLRYPLDNKILELLMYYPEINAQKFSKDNFPQFKAQQWFPSSAGKWAGQLTATEKGNFDPACFDFLSWIRVKAWFPLFSHEKYLIILVAGPDNQKNLDLGHVLFAWLTTQADFSRKSSGRMHQYFLSGYEGLNELSACSSVNQFVISLAYMLVDVTSQVVRNSAVFETKADVMQLLASFSLEYRQSQVSKNTKEELRSHISKGGPENEFFGERKFKCKKAFPSSRMLEATLGCKECEVTPASALRNVFKGATSSSSSPKSKRINSAHFTFALDDRYFALVVELDDTLDALEVDFVKSTVQAFAAQTCVIELDRSVTPLAVAN